MPAEPEAFDIIDMIAEGVDATKLDKQGAEEGWEMNLRLGKSG